ncbi:phosphinothricin N-acetyltransferase, putative [Roseibium aggregatum IAM 12614]|uniref:Phosphinothricin N-acetyltransferase, putative n=1 Tax=Roseibium aggregatum (strain ATCC 25650 / DSM 13394 / JCM 20685 / NBRC 16684 / NCIMB 2208 / IAM 12614 / B1) TaxID=384765 RepID=A0NS34_ROSAI|nr:GNAT family N-acetyltransferase [Roseibium aggregatum]EAV44363.1 phosphinothricin N-acetyltransferase, putative [Roseibium aggregatum IAM 12614]
MLIRNAEPKDVPAILARYNQAVRETTAAWTSREETLDERLTWFEGRMKQDLPVLVAVDETDAVLGFASFGPFRPREGYRLTAEHSVYVDPAAQRRGIGRALLERLMEIANAKNLHVLVGVIDGGNAASIALHEKLGFHVAGRLPEAGTKFGCWLDLVFVAKVLGPMQSPEA